MVGSNMIILSFLVLLCLIQQAWLARPYPQTGDNTSRAKDPSTVINVYPSLVNLARGNKQYESGVPCTTDACVAASNIRPKWTGNGTKTALRNDKGEMQPTETNRNEASSDDLIKKKMSKVFREQNENYKPTVHYQKHDPRFRKYQEVDDLAKKPYTWASFQDMLQLLKKRKH